MIIIVTGNIGCGKSTVVKQLKASLPDYEVFNVDVMVKDLYNNVAFKQFLHDVIGATDKAVVSDIVFKDSGLRKRLEDESMKYLNQQIFAVLQKDNAILEFPLFFEAGGRLKYATQGIKVLAVTCSPATQLQRVMNRDNFPPEKIARIRASQLSSELKATMADYAIDTDQSTTEQVANVVAKLKHEHMREMALRLEGRALKFFRGISPSVAKDIWGKLRKAYTEPHRHYHVLEHLLAMFALFDHYVKKDCIRNPAAVELAIWWHDFVYHTDDRYYDNESASVRAMVACFQEAKPDFVYDDQWASIVSLAGEFILSTKGHEVRSPYILEHPHRLNDNHFFLDIDLAVLGKLPEVVEEFDENIYREFAPQYEIKVFAAGRIATMRTFLLRPSVYYTNEFKQAYEATARTNLNNIIVKWASK